MELFFSDYFRVNESDLEEFGAFNISLITDLPLFVDPFLLFNSSEPKHALLHEEMINYLKFLKNKSESQHIDNGLLSAWFMFGEVSQNWLGFCESDNRGRGLGRKFAIALNENLSHIFVNFGKEQISEGSHIEKLCLLGKGIGRDMISDFTNNLIKWYLLDYTAEFTHKYINKDLTKKFTINRAYFDYGLERWMAKHVVLPFYAEKNDYVLLTPTAFLTKDETWINYKDMVRSFDEIPEAINNEQLRSEINNYFYARLPKTDKIKKQDYEFAIFSTLRKYPELIDWYIKAKEQSGHVAVELSASKVIESQHIYNRHTKILCSLLNEYTQFYSITGNTREESLQKINYLKDVIENKGGHKIFFGKDNIPIRKESDLHILFKLVWHGSPSDVSAEVNDGRGPADFKISRGAYDKTIIEFKLASNTHLEKNLISQLDIYKDASSAQYGYKVILYFSQEERARVKKILTNLKMEKDENIILIDADPENKPSASKA